MEGDFSTFSVKELKKFITDRGQKFTDCIEKSDLIQKAKDIQHIDVKVKKEETSEHVLSTYSYGSLVKTTLSGLECIILKGKGKPKSIIIILHGYGANNMDFVPVGQEIMNNTTAESAQSQWWIFPNAIRPLSAAGGGGSGREWWPLDLNQLLTKFMMGTLTKEKPVGLDMAHKAMIELISAVTEETGLSTEDIVLGGFSQGAMLATDVALRIENNLKGLVILSGLLLCEDEWRTSASNHKGLKVFQSHGTKDQLLAFPLATQLKGVLESGGLEVEFVSFDGGHTVPSQSIRGLNNFLNNL